MSWQQQHQQQQSTPSVEADVARGVVQFVQFINTVMRERDFQPARCWGSEVRAEVGQRYYALWSNQTDSYNPCGHLLMHIEKTTGCVRYRSGLVARHPVHADRYTLGAMRQEDHWYSYLTEPAALL